MTPELKLLALETWLQMREDAVAAVALYKSKIDEQVVIVKNLDVLIAEAKKQL